MMGEIQGGWEYVWAAYGISAVVFVGYTASVLLRWRSAVERRARESGAASRTSTGASK